MEYTITIYVESQTADDAAQVQTLLQDLARVNGARGLLNLKKQLDTSAMVKASVHKILKK